MGEDKADGLGLPEVSAPHVLASDLVGLAAKQVELSEAEYRHMLVLAGDVASATELDHKGFEAALAILEHLGFRPLGSGGSFYGERPGLASPAQVEYIRGRSGTRPRPEHRRAAKRGPDADRARPFSLAEVPAWARGARPGTGRIF